jgi:hypothetical protein
MLGPEISAAAFLERLLPVWRSGAARVSDRRFAELLVSERAAILSLIEDALERRADAPTWMVDRRRLSGAWNDVEPSAAATGPRRWEITLGGDLRVDGVAVCSGPVAGLRALGRELHERGYPRLTREVVEAFRLREPGRGELVSADGLSATTQGLIRLLSSAGASEVAVRAYLGLGAAHWRAHQVAPGARTWLHAKLARMMPLTPTEAAWALEFDEPHGWRLALDLLRRTEALGLATQTRPGRWVRTEAGEALAREAGGPSDLREVWIVRAEPRNEFPDAAVSVAESDLELALNQRAGSTREIPILALLRGRHHVALAAERQGVEPTLAWMLALIVSERAADRRGVDYTPLGLLTEAHDAQEQLGALGVSPLAARENQRALWALIGELANPGAEISKVTREVITANDIRRLLYFAGLVLVSAPKCGGPLRDSAERALARARKAYSAALALIVSNRPVDERVEGALQRLALVAWALARYCGENWPALVPIDDAALVAAWDVEEQAHGLWREDVR